MVAQIIRIHQDAKTPSRNHATDAGWDISSVEDCTIPAGDQRAVQTGLRIVVPEGYYYSIEGRSGLGRKGIVPHRGILDAYYSGPVVAVLYNHTGLDYQVHAGDRIAQIVFHRCDPWHLEVVEELSPGYIGKRGTDGFGSSGR